MGHPKAFFGMKGAAPPPMKYFTKEFIKADNDSSLTKAQSQKIDKKFNRNCKAYRRQLGRLESRISKQAWNFFYFGFGRWGLHDARLMSFTVGDGLDYRPDGKQPFRINKQKAKVRIKILNHDQNLLCAFNCSGIRKVAFEFPSDDPLWNSGQVDDLHSYELTEAGKHFMCLEFLFTSGATILVEFARLKFDRKRIKRSFTTEAAYS
jgi:hypothetical protein